MREGCLPRGNSGVSLRLESVNDETISMLYDPSKPESEIKNHEQVKILKDFKVEFLGNAPEQIFHLRHRKRAH